MNTVGVAINHSMYGTSAPTIEAAERQLLADLVASGLRVRLIAIHENVENEAVAAQVDVSQVEIFALATAVHRGARRVVNYLLALLRWPLAIRGLQAIYFFAPSHVTWIGLLWARVLGVPYGVYVRGAFFNRQGEIATRWQTPFRHARFLIVTGLTFQRRLLALNSRVLNEVPLTPLAAYAKTQVDYARPFRRVLFAGRLAEEKGILIVLQAVARLAMDSPLELIVAGAGTEGEMRKFHGALRAMPAGSVQFLGHVKDPSALADAYREADALAFPSWYGEGFPRVLYEAMMFGLPIITSPLPGTDGFLVDGRNALMCAPRDVDALVDAIAKLVNSSDLRQRLGEGARADWQALARTFDSPSHSAQLIGELEALT